MPTNIHLELIHLRRRCVGVSSTDSYMKGGYGGDAYAQSPALDLQVDSIPIQEVWSVSPCVLGRKKNVATRVGSDQSGQSARVGPCAPVLRRAKTCVVFLRSRALIVACSFSLGLFPPRLFVRTCTPNGRGGSRVTTNVPRALHPLSRLRDAVCARSPTSFDCLWRPAYVVRRSKVRQVSWMPMQRHRSYLQKSPRLQSLLLQSRGASQCRTAPLTRPNPPRTLPFRPPPILQRCRYSLPAGGYFLWGTCTAAFGAAPVSFEGLRPVAFVARGSVSFLVCLCHLSPLSYQCLTQRLCVDVSRRQWEVRIATTRQMSVCLRVRMHPHIDVHGHARRDTSRRQCLTRVDSTATYGGEDKPVSGSDSVNRLSAQFAATSVSTPVSPWQSQPADPSSGKKWADPMAKAKKSVVLESN